MDTTEVLLDAVLKSQNARVTVSVMLTILGMSARKSSHGQIFKSLLQPSGNDQLRSERQKNWGVTMLVFKITGTKDDSIYRSFDS